MKKVFSVLLCVAMVIGICACGGGSNAQSSEGSGETLTVFNLGEYMDPELLDMFEEETGIKVEYEEATTPEEMYSKYTSGAINYDVICSSGSMMHKLIKEGELQKVDYKSLENYKNIDEYFWKMLQTTDENNEYLMPHFYGTLGILYDTTKVKEPVDSWDVLFNGEYSGEIIMQNSMRECYMVALKALGYSLNTTDKAQIDEAQALLVKQRPDVQAYLVDEARDEVAGGNAVMAVVYSGEAYLGHDYNPDLAYVVPKEGSNGWVDSWGITKKCQNMDAAMKFLNFLMREDVAYTNYEYIYYSTPNKAAVDMMEDDFKNNPYIVIDKSELERCEIDTDCGQELNDYYNDLWKTLKSN